MKNNKWSSYTLEAQYCFLKKWPENQDGWPGVAMWKIVWPVALVSQSARCCNDVTEHYSKLQLRQVICLLSITGMEDMSILRIVAGSVDRVNCCWLSPFLVSGPRRDPWPYFCSFQDIWMCLKMGATLRRQAALVGLVNCCWSSPAQSFFVPLFYCPTTLGMCLVHLNVNLCVAMQT
jgi:hypothetical protein